MLEIKDISQGLLNKFFQSNVIPHIQLDRSETFSTEFNEDELIEIKKIASNSNTVVGIDIYQYSQFSTEKQIFIPHLFDLIYKETWNLIKQNFSFLFQKYGKVININDSKCMDPKDYFINTGDGGYQILETPIHGVIFILTFAIILRLYNADRFMRRIHAKIGNIDVRYAMTLDDIYRYRGNFYGAGIINNSRILSKDLLNRFIIDQNVYNWFLNRIIGIENLMSLCLLDLKDIEEFIDYDKSKIDEGNNAVIPEKSDLITREGIKSIDVQKIGKVRQKQTFLDIYNLHIQALIQYENLLNQKQIVTVSVGNLNTIGIGNDEI